MSHYVEVYGGMTKVELRVDCILDKSIKLFLCVYTFKTP